MVVRADHGTENCCVAKMQIAFRLHYNDSRSGNKSFIYGPSTANTVSIVKCTCSHVVLLHSYDDNAK